MNLYSWEEKERAEHAEWRKRQSQIDVEDHKKIAAAQLLEQIKELDSSKKKMIESMTEKNEKQIKELSDAKELELAEKTNQIQSQISKEHENLIMALEKEHSLNAQYDKQRLDMVKKNQAELSSEISNILKKSAEENLKEAEKNEEFRNFLTDKTTKLLEEQRLELCEAQRKSNELRLEKAKEVEEKEKQHFERKLELMRTNAQESANEMNRLLQLRITTAKNDDLKAINSGITTAQKLAEMLQNHSSDASEIIDEKMDMNTRENASTELKFVNNDLSKLLNCLGMLGERATKMDDETKCEELIGQIISIKKNISAVKGTITDIRRELRKSTTAIDVDDRDKFDKQIREIVDGVIGISHVNITFAVNRELFAEALAVEYEE